MEKDKPRIIINPPMPEGEIKWDRTIHHLVELEGREIDFGSKGTPMIAVLVCY